MRCENRLKKRGGGAVVPPPKKPGMVFVRKLSRLGLGLWLIWFFLWVLTPVVVAHCPPLARYGDAALENDIQPGALYYTDVPVSAEAERNSRDTVRFLPRGMP